MERKIRNGMEGWGRNEGRNYYGGKKIAERVGLNPR
jgi:hypothetical protein